jgi:hypothetical protein
VRKGGEETKKQQSGNPEEIKKMKREAKTNDSICAICEQTGSLVSEADRQTEREIEKGKRRD